MTESFIVSFKYKRFPGKSMKLLFIRQNYPPSYETSKVRVMQNFHKFFFRDIYAWLDRAHRFTWEKVVFEILKAISLKKIFSAMKIPTTAFLDIFGGVNRYFNFFFILLNL